MGRCARQNSGETALPPFRRPHPLDFDRVANFRDLAGHTTVDGARVASGRLFRSGHLADASDDDVARLESLGLRCVFDFRNESDIQVEGRDRLPPTTRHQRLPMPDPARGESVRSIISDAGPDELEELFGDGKAAAMMESAAESLVRERREVYRIFLSELSQPASQPALFHCSAGKDRAGWAGSIVLLALGVDEAQVIEQYLLSNQNIEAIRRRFEQPGQRSWVGLMAPFMEVRREYIAASFTAMHAEWWSFDRYLHEGLGITREQRSALRESLLE
jgi:protein-tyrosine phosphatase